MAGKPPVAGGSRYVRLGASEAATVENSLTCFGRRKNWVQHEPNYLLQPIANVTHVNHRLCLLVQCLVLTGEL